MITSKPRPMPQVQTESERWLGSIEVDQRQRFIASTDKLQEMVGGSGLIAQTVADARAATKPAVELVWPVSGVIRFSSADHKALCDTLWNLRTRFIHEYGLSVTISLVVYMAGELARALQLADHAARVRKDATIGSDGSPQHPLFVPCSIQPELAANQWRPGSNAKEEKRAPAQTRKRSERRTPGSGTRCLSKEVPTVRPCESSVAAQANRSCRRHIRFLRCAH